MPQPLPIPTSFSDDRRRDPPRKKLRPADTLIRAATCELLRMEMRPGMVEDVEDTLARHYGSDVATLAYLERAAVSPASTSVATWAAELVATSIADFLGGPQGVSAFTALAAKAMSVTLPPGTGVLKIPSRASPQVLVGSWVGENNAKPVTTIPLTTTSLVPYKLAAISVFSEELLMASVPSIEAVVTEVLRHDLDGLLTQSLLDSTAASSTRPAGLFNGVTPLTASTATPSSEAMFKDLGALAGAVESGNPDARPVYLANTAQVARMIAAGFEAIATGYLAAGTVACVDAAALAMTASPPMFAQSRDAALHMDSVPTALSAVGTPNVVSAPSHSMFQDDTVAIRSTMFAGWIRRRTGCTAIVTGVTW